MKLIIKTLQGKQLPIEVEESLTIREVKEVIEKEHSMQADLLKLIAYGKVMDSDTKTLKEHSLKDGDFIVCMVTKAKPAPKQQPKPEDAKQEESNQASSTTTTNQETNQQPTTTTTTTNNDTTQQQQQQQPEASATQLTAEQESQVTGLVESTGRTREDCVKALQFTKEPNSAFELLLSTEGQPIEQVIQALQQHAALGGAGGDGMEDDGGDYNEGDEGGFDHDIGAGGIAQLQQLAQNPNFALIRQRIIQDPSFYNQFLQSLQTQQPELFQVIQANPAAFMNLIMGGNVNAGLGLGGGQAQPGMGMNPGQQQQQQNPPGTVRVSQEEMEAIDRLASLGFPKARAAEAYFACDKNEEFAANFLFEAGQEDEDTATQNAIIASQQNQNQQQPQQNQQNQEQQQQQDQQQDNNNNNNDNNGGNEGGNNGGDNNGGDGGNDGGSSLI